MSNARNLARLLPNASGQLPDAAMASGSVLQVVTMSMTSQFTTSNTGYVDTGLEATITPINSNSKILILANPEIGVTGSGGINSTCYMCIVRNGTLVTKRTSRLYSYNANGIYHSLPEGLIYVDSPNSAAALTYKLQIALGSNTTVYLNAENPNSTSTITLMEIAG